MKALPKQFRQSGFEADYRYISSKSASNYVGKLHVDKFGREREEIYIACKSGWEMTFIDIWDIVDLKEYALSAQDKKILHQKSIDINTFHRELDIGVPGIMGYIIPRHSPSGGEDLGVRQIEDLVCKGSRRNFSGYGEYPDGIIECWYSEVISYLVFAKAVFGDLENIFQLQNIQLIEPDKALFTMPANYTS